MCRRMSRSVSRSPRLGRRADVGLGDDLHQRDAGPIEVDQAVPAPAVLQARGVLLEVRG